MTPLDPEKFFTPCDPDAFEFETTATLPHIEGIIGQESALEAIRFGTDIRQEGFNLFIMGPSGSGKHSVISRYLRDKAKNESAPSDWCYVHNFRDERKPIALKLPTGESPHFKEALKTLLGTLKNQLPKLLDSDAYHKQKAAIEKRISDLQGEIFNYLHDEARNYDVAMTAVSTTQINFVPVHDGKRLSAEEFDAIMGEEKAAMTQKMQAFEQIVKEKLIDVTRLNKELDTELEALDTGLITESVKAAMQKLYATFGSDERVAHYLDALQADLIESSDAFMPQSGTEDVPAMLQEYYQPSFERYEVNCFITHDKNGHAPVIYEDNPVHQNLIGRIEHDTQMGTLITNFTMITPGALHRASGGYLILDARKLLMEPFAYEELKRVLQSREVRIESLNRQYSFIDTTTLDPEAIPVDIKVVLIGERDLYYLLYYYDPDFKELFKVSADFEEDLPRSSENLELYARMIGTIAHEHALLPLTRGAVCRVIEQSARSAEHASRISTHMRSLADLLKEADYLAAADRSATIDIAHIERALAARVSRMNRVQRRIYEQIEEGNIFIRTHGAEVGMINALSYISMGGYHFGMPSRITARTRIGNGEIIDIERKVELGGPIHSKGVMILSAYLGSKYAPDTPLSLSASLAFEQNYGEIEGDSASSTELYALLSSLSCIPIRQNFAVTGSVNQFGEVQPIGGVNEKIEGFFDICMRLDPQGSYGVVIPHANVKHLMLKREVTEAAQRGQFEIHAVRTIDEGITVLTGVDAGTVNAKGSYPKTSVNALVMAQLKSYSRSLQKLRSKE